MPPKPALEDFKTLEGYLEALVTWHLDQRFAAADRDWLRVIGVDPE